MFKPRLNDRGMLESLGLVGDGDEISAIEEVERQVGVTLDHSWAATSRCVGDIHTALLAALPSGRRSAPDAWARFAQAMATETDVNPAQICPETLLLSPARGHWTAMVVFAALVGGLFALLR